MAFATKMNRLPGQNCGIFHFNDDLQWLELKITINIKRFLLLHSLAFILLWEDAKNQKKEVIVWKIRFLIGLWRNEVLIKA